VELRGRLQNLHTRIETLASEVEKLEWKARELSGHDSVQEINGAQAALEEEMIRVRELRDRKFLLAAIVREADRGFRETHQPELLRRASDYLARITGDRYSQLYHFEEGEHRGFSLKAESAPENISLEGAISTGTREQAYLALRLSIVDMLDRDQETLPIFLDEAFVNWDPQRRRRGLDLLAEMSGSRQIFLMTCHPHVAQELEERGGRTLELQGP
jgi:uncharacterized protein YhaN